MLKKVLGGLAIVIALFLAYVAFQPSHFKISREILIQAPPEVIYPHLNNSKLANDWMPWSEKYLGLEIKTSGPEEGVGARSTWDSDTKMGTGEALVVENKENEYVMTKLTYVKPMAMEQLAVTSLHPQENGTIVRWSVTGKNSFVGRLMCTFMDMDEMVGKEFMKGLNNLKAIVEKK